MSELIIECLNKCWCEFCSKEIIKEEKCLILYKQARKGVTRTNICKICIVKLFLELNPKKKEINVIRKELILNALENK